VRKESDKKDVQCGVFFHLISLVDFATQCFFFEEWARDNIHRGLITSRCIYRHDEAKRKEMGSLEKKGCMVGGI
jgi:hypothetical protein